MTQPPRGLRGAIYEKFLISGVAGADGIFSGDGGFAAEEVGGAPLVGLQHVIEEEAAAAPHEVGRAGPPVGAAAGQLLVANPAGASVRSETPPRRSITSFVA
jgi:hypothetical protein